MAGDNVKNKNDFYDTVTVGQDSANEGLRIDQSGTETALFINQDADGVGLYIDSEATTDNKYGILVDMGGNGARPAKFSYDTNLLVYFDTPDSASGSWRFYRNYNSDTTAGPVMSVENDHASDDQPALKIKQDGYGDAIEIDCNNYGDAITIAFDGNNASNMHGLVMNIANAGAGTEYAFGFFGSEVVSAAVGGTQDKKIRVNIGGTTYYIPCHTA